MAFGYDELSPFFTSNLEWAANQDPEHFAELAKGQEPPILWFGCSDSRVPETTVMGRHPGEIFTHRNIANQFQKNDVGAHAVLDYGVLHLGVKHVFVVGHTHCGGCKGAWNSPLPASEVDVKENPLGAFLGPLVTIRHNLPAEASVKDLIQANVEQSVRNIAESQTMKTAWDKGQKTVVHGMVYNIELGTFDDFHVVRGPPA